VFDEREQRPFARIERHEVEVIEHARLVHFAQLGVAIPATQNGDDGRVRLLDGLSDSKCAVHVAGKRRGDEHERRLILRQCLECQLAQ